MNIHLLLAIGQSIFTTEKRQLNSVNENITKHKFYFELHKPNMTDLQMLGNSFREFGLVSTYQRFIAVFDPKVHLFENSLQKILAQL